MQGIGVSPGISIGRAFVLRRRKEVATGIVLADEAAVQREVDRYREAVQVSVGEIRQLFSVASEEEKSILEVQQELLQDPQMESDVLERVRREKMTARDAVLVVTELAVRVFTEMDDEYLRARGADVQDAGNRIARNLSEAVASPEADARAGMGEEMIVIAQDLSPSDTIGMDRGKVAGFATQAGGRTSHTAIIARLRGLPAVVGCGAVLEGITDGDLVILDGGEGLVLVNPGIAVVEDYRIKRERFIEEVRQLEALDDQPAVTKDGIRIELFANIGTLEDMEQALALGAEGVGLLRTEMLFMERESFPTEEEQFNFYKAIVLRAEGREVTIRTVDIGGDKPLPYLGLPKEENPFLGYRGIRVCLDRKEFFLTQLRAILRASAFGNCRILLPMISSVNEVREAKSILREAKEHLNSYGVAFDADIPLGIMIETPSAALTADLLAKEADFFSIGTNDLCQYVLAVDRMNERLKQLYDPFHPAVLRLIRYVIEQGQLRDIPVGMCGEMAGDPEAVQVLLGMGLREFSMAATAIPVIKDILLQSSEEEARKNLRL
jgi:phosphotransferase system enzyme I (PtsI)